MDSVYILFYHDGGVVSIHYDGDDAHDALDKLVDEGTDADAYIEQWEVS